MSSYYIKKDFKVKVDNFTLPDDLICDFKYAFFKLGLIKFICFVFLFFNNKEFLDVLIVKNKDFLRKEVPVSNKISEKKKKKKVSSVLKNKIKKNLILQKRAQVSSLKNSLPNLSNSVGKIVKKEISKLTKIADIKFQKLFKRKKNNPSNLRRKKLRAEKYNVLDYHLKRGYKFSFNSFSGFKIIDFTFNQNIGIYQFNHSKNVSNRTFRAYFESHSLDEMKSVSYNFDELYGHYQSLLKPIITYKPPFVGPRPDNWRFLLENYVREVESITDSSSLFEDKPDKDHL